MPSFDPAFGPEAIALSSPLVGARSLEGAQQEFPSIAYSVGSGWGIFVSTMSLPGSV